MLGTVVCSAEEGPVCVVSILDLSGFVYVRLLSLLFFVSLVCGNESTLPIQIYVHKKLLSIRLLQMYVLYNIDVSKLKSFYKDLYLMRTVSLFFDGLSSQSSGSLIRLIIKFT